MREIVRKKDPNSIFTSLTLLTRRILDSEEAAKILDEIRENRIIPDGNESMTEHEFQISEGKAGRRKEDKRKEASIILLLSGFVCGATVGDHETREKLEGVLLSWSDFFTDADASCEPYAREWFRFSIRHGMLDLNDIWAKNFFGHVGGEKKGKSIIDIAAVEAHGKHFFSTERIDQWIKYGWNPNDEEKEILSWGISVGKIDAGVADLVRHSDLLEPDSLPEPLGQNEDECDSSITANLGVWSEIGTFLMLVTEGKINIPGDPSSPIILKTASIDGHEAILDKKRTLCIKGVSKNKQIFEIERKWADRILQKWDDNFVRLGQSSSFAPKNSLAELLTRLSGGEGYSLNTSREKTDISATGVDSFGKERKFKISVKSFGYGDPSLFNASAQSSIEYSIENVRFSEMRCLNWVDDYKEHKNKEKERKAEKKKEEQEAKEGRCSEKKERKDEKESKDVYPINDVSSNGGKLKFHRFVGKDFEESLRQIDKNLPELVATFVAASNKFYGCNSKSLPEIIYHFANNPEVMPEFLQEQDDPERYMFNMVDKWLHAAATSMTSTGRSKSGMPNSFAFTSSDAAGKLIVDIYPFEQFDAGKILLPAAKLDAPSRSRHISAETPHSDFPDAFPYMDNGQNFIRLNHQIRIKKFTPKPTKSPRIK